MLCGRDAPPHTAADTNCYVSTHTLTVPPVGSHPRTRGRQYLLHDDRGRQPACSSSVLQQRRHQPHDTKHMRSIMTA